MTRRFSKLRMLLLAGAAFSACLTCHAQQFVYTNDNIAESNSTTALTVSSKGSVTVLHSYATGGRGIGDSGFLASQPIASAQTAEKWCLFVSNSGSSNIAAFQVDVKNGSLTTVQGSPFSDGASGRQSYGMSLATGAGKLLFAANTTSNTISVMKISSDCALKLTSTTEVSYAPVGLKVTPNGNFLIASYLGPVDSFKIDYETGSVTELGPFAAQGPTAGIATRF